jgi:AraC-like DNA-binding protein
MSGNSLPELVNSGIFEGEKYIDFHSHRGGSELVYLLRGDCGMEAGGKSLRGQAESLFILPSSSPHSQTNYGLVRTIYVSFRAGSFFDDNPRVVKGDRWIKTWMRHIYMIHRGPAGAPAVSIPALLGALLSRAAALSAESGKSQASHPALRSALEYIENNQDKPFSLTETAAFAGISASRLCALFSKEFGKGPASVSHELKMARAARFLSEPYLSVKEAAAACGFTDANYFARFFRQRAGVSPTEYRQRRLRQ